MPRKVRGFGSFSQWPYPSEKPFASNNEALEDPKVFDDVTDALLPEIYARARGVSTGALGAAL